MTDNGENRILVIYIAGYGRSGSTVLDLALSATCSYAVSLGEIGSLPDVVRRPRLGCSCGEGYLECNLWSTILEHVISSVGSGRLERISRQDGPWGFFRAPGVEYSKFWERVLRKRLNFSQSDAFGNYVVVDSTKTALFNSSRPKNLSALEGFDVIVVHLKRSLRGVLRSRGRGRNIDLAGLTKRKSVRERITGGIWPVLVPISWLAANIFAEIVKRDRRIIGSVNINFDAVKKSPEDAALDVWAGVEALLKRRFKVERTQKGIAAVVHIVEGNRLAKDGGEITIRRENGK